MSVSGFYEWKRDVNPKQPYYFHRTDDDPLAFAALWETWQGAAELVESCCLITTEANELMATIHDRMPVILDPQDYDWWIMGKTEEVGQLLVPCPSEWLDAYPVSRRVNSTRNEGPELIQSVR